jgi:beta-glucosidase-like glycosyl hydrolase
MWPFASSSSHQQTVSLTLAKVEGMPPPDFSHLMIPDVWVSLTLPFGRPALGVPAYYWGTNCLHSLNGGECVVDSHNVTKCPTNFPSGPSFGATFNRGLITKMANVIGVELRALNKLGDMKHFSLDCWGLAPHLN